MAVIATPRFYLDANVVLCEILQDRTSRMEKFKRDVEKSRVSCFISASVKSEIESIIKRIVEYADSTVRSMLAKYDKEKTKSAKNGKIPSFKSSEDFVKLERLFAQEYAGLVDLARNPALETDATQRMSYLRGFEEAAITMLQQEVWDKGESHMEDFSKSMVSKVIEFARKLRTIYADLVLAEKFCHIDDRVPEHPFITAFTDLGIPRGDSTHLAVAYQCALEVGANIVVFVSFDYSHITNRQADIQQAMNLRCADPLYAIYHLESKRNGPTSYT